MKHNLSSEQIALMDSITEFARNRINPELHRIRRSDADFREVWKLCAEMGLLGVSVDAAYGGLGLDAFHTALAIEAFAYGCKDNGLCFALSAHALACCVPIQKFGNDAIRQRYLSKMVSGDLIACNGMTESSGGSDAYNMNTLIDIKSEKCRIQGAKTFVSNVADADLAVVYGANDKEKGFFGGISCLVLERNQFRAGTIFEKMGLKTASFGELYIDDVEVDITQMVGKAGAGGSIFNRSMEWERICLSAMHVGSMQRVFDRSTVFLKERRSGLTPLMKISTVSHKVAELYAGIQACRELVYAAAKGLDVQKNNNIQASATKLFVSEYCKKFMMEMMQLLGGYGYTVEAEIEQDLRDAMGSTIYSGTSEIQKNIITSELGF